MAVKTKKGTVATFRALVEAISAWVTDSTIHGADAWELMRDAPWPYGTIYKAKGRADGDRQYIGIMPNQYNKGVTYDNWFFTEKNLSSYFLWGKDIFDTLTYLQNKAFLREIPPAEFNFAHREIIFRNSGGTYYFYFPDPVDIFKNSAQALHFGTFKQFSGAPFADLGGAMDFGSVNIRPYYVRISYSPISGRGYTTSFPFIPPVYPGCGYPALTLDYSGAMDGYIDYWLIKSASYLIVAIRNGDVWEAAFAGQFEPYDAMEEYAFPAAAIGGTSGLREISENQSVIINDRWETRPVSGMMFDYRPHAWELTRSIPPFAAVPEDSESAPSPVMVMLPDGRWQGFSNYVQGSDLIPRALSATAFYVRPGEKDISDFFSDIDEEKDEHLLEPLEFLQGQGDRKGVLGRIPQMFLPSRQIQKYGEIVSDGVKYLSLPNGWEGRRFTTQTTATGYDEKLSEERTITKRSECMNLMIRMED